MSIKKDKLLLLQSKQFISNPLVLECYSRGINVKYPFTYIPDLVVRSVYHKFSLVFDTVRFSKFVKKHIQYLEIIRCYKGFRHRKGLPVRGQRTRTNSQTRKKNKPKDITIVNKKNAVVSKKGKVSKKN